MAPTAKTVDPTLRARIVAGVKPETRFEGFAMRISQLFDITIERTHELFCDIDRFPDEPWTEAKIPNAYALHFEGGARLAAAECGIVHMAPGTSFPLHSGLKSKDEQDEAI